MKLRYSYSKKPKGGEILTRLEKSIEIQSAPEKVWPFVLWEKCPDWYDVFKKVEWTSKDKYKVGATVHVISELAGVKAIWDAEVTEWKENEKGAWRSTAGNFTNFGYVALTPSELGTKVSFVMDYDLPYSILGKVLDKLRFHGALEKSFDVGLKKLKAMAEK